MCIRDSFGILCIKRPISCIRQLAEGIVLIDFANQFFQFSGSLLGSSQTPALFRYIGTLLSNLRLLNSVNKFRPVISRIFSDSPERVGNQCQDSTLIAVSYTHLDVYKRQVYKCALVNKGLMACPRILAGLQSIPQPPEDGTG